MIRARSTITLRVCVCVLIDPSGCTTGDVRLTGGATNYSGMVELCSDNQWRVICDDTWDDSEAIVVCKQLNYSTNGRCKLINDILVCT